MLLDELEATSVGFVSLAGGTDATTPVGRAADAHSRVFVERCNQSWYRAERERVHSALSFIGVNPDAEPGRAFFDAGVLRPGGRSEQVRGNLFEGERPCVLAKVCGVGRVLNGPGPER